MCEERRNKLLNESNGVIPSAAFRDAVNLDVLHCVSILFSSLCSFQQFHFKAHCSSLQGAFLLVDRSFSHPSPSDFPASNAYICQLKNPSHIPWKKLIPSNRKRFLFVGPSTFCPFCVFCSSRISAMAHTYQPRSAGKVRELRSVFLTLARCSLPRGLLWKEDWTSSLCVTGRRHVESPFDIFCLFSYAISSYHVSFRKHINIAFKMK